MILPFEGIWPKIHETAFVAPSADIVGDVVIGEQSSVWFQVVIRGDVNTIRIGKRTNIQDHSVLHVTRVKCPLVLGDEITVGHRVSLHGCTLKNRILVGMGSIIMDNAVIEDDCIIGAGSLVTQGTVIPAGSLAMGSPARVVRQLTGEEIEFLKKSAGNYVGDSVKYQAYVQGPKKLGDDQQDLETFGNGFESEFDGE